MERTRKLRAELTANETITEALEKIETALYAVSKGSDDAEDELREMSRAIDKAGDEASEASAKMQGLAGSASTAAGAMELTEQQAKDLDRELDGIDAASVVDMVDDTTEAFNLLREESYLTEDAVDGLEGVFNLKKDKDEIKGTREELEAFQYVVEDVNESFITNYMDGDSFIDEDKLTDEADATQEVVDSREKLAKANQKVAESREEVADAEEEVEKATKKSRSDIDGAASRVRTHKQMRQSMDPQYHHENLEAARRSTEGFKKSINAPAYNKNPNSDAKYQTATTTTRLGSMSNRMKRIREAAEESADGVDEATESLDRYEGKAKTVGDLNRIFNEDGDKTVRVTQDQVEAMQENAKARQQVASANKSMNNSARRTSKDVSLEGETFAETAENAENLADMKELAKDSNRKLAKASGTTTKLIEDEKDEMMSLAYEADNADDFLRRLRKSELELASAADQAEHRLVEQNDGINKVNDASRTMAMQAAINAAKNDGFADSIQNVNRVSREMDSEMDMSAASISRLAMKSQTAHGFIDSLSAANEITEEQAEKAKRAIDKEGDASMTTAAQSLVLAGALDITEEQLEDVKREAKDASESLGILSGDFAATSLNVGPFNFALRNMLTNIPLLAMAVGSLATAVLGLATAFLAANAAILAFAGGGLFLMAEQIAATSSEYENAMEAMEEILSDLLDTAKEVIAPIVNTQSLEMFKALVNGTASALNMMFQSMASMQDALQGHMGRLGESFFANWDTFLFEIAEMVGDFIPVLEGMFTWFMEKLPQAIDFFRKETLNFLPALSKFFNSVVNFFAAMSEFGVELFSGLFHVLSPVLDGISKLVRLLDEVPNRLLKVATAMGAFLFVGGKFIGIGRSLADTMTTLWTVARGGHDAFDGLTDVLRKSNGSLANWAWVADTAAEKFGYLRTVLASMVSTQVAVTNSMGRVSLEERTGVAALSAHLDDIRFRARKAFRALGSAAADVARGPLNMLVAQLGVVASQFRQLGGLGGVSMTSPNIRGRGRQRAAGAAGAVAGLPAAKGARSRMARIMDRQRIGLGGMKGFNPVNAAMFEGAAHVTKQSYSNVGDWGRQGIKAREWFETDDLSTNIMGRPSTDRSRMAGLKRALTPEAMTIGRVRRRDGSATGRLARRRVTGAQALGVKARRGMASARSRMGGAVTAMSLSRAGDGSVSLDQLTGMDALRKKLDDARKSASRLISTLIDPKASFGIWQTLTERFGMLRASIVDAIASLRTFIVTQARSIKQTVVQSSLTTRLSNAFKTLKTSLFSVVGALWGYITTQALAITGNSAFVHQLALIQAQSIPVISGLIGIAATFLSVAGTAGIAAGAMAAFSFALDMIGIGLLFKLAAVAALLAGAFGMMGDEGNQMGGIMSFVGDVMGYLFDLILGVGVPAWNALVDVMEFVIALGQAVNVALSGIFGFLSGDGDFNFLNAILHFFKELAWLFGKLFWLFGGFFDLLTKVLALIPGVQNDTLSGAKVDSTGARAGADKAKNKAASATGMAAANEQGPAGSGGEAGVAGGQKTEYNHTEKHEYHFGDFHMDPEEKANVKSLVRDALDEANRNRRLRNGSSG